MKKYTLALLAPLVGIAAPASASDPFLPMVTYCESMAEFAEEAMEFRQLGGEKQAIIDIVNDSTADGSLDGARDVMLSYVDIAFEREIFRSEKKRNESISEFSAEMYDMCIEIMSKKAFQP